MAEAKATITAPPEAKEAAKEAAAAGAAAAKVAEATAAAAKEEAKLLAKPPVAIGGVHPEDVLGRELPADPDERRAQEREAVIIRQANIREDTLRVERGLPPLHAAD